MEPKQMILQLLKSGKTQAELAAQLKTSQPTVNRISKGLQDPKYALYQRIEAAFRDHQAA